VRASAKSWAISVCLRGSRKSPWLWPRKSNESRFRTRLGDCDASLSTFTSGSRPGTRQTMEPQGTIARPPTSGEILGDRIFRGTALGFAWFVILLVVLIVWQIGFTAAPTVQEHGAKLLLSDKWDGKDNFGILPEIVGTLYSSILGVAIGAFFGI